MTGMELRNTLQRFLTHVMKDLASIQPTAHLRCMPTVVRCAVNKWTRNGLGGVTGVTPPTAGYRTLSGDTSGSQEAPCPPAPSVSAHHIHSPSAATCDLDNLPDVTYAGDPEADSTAVIPGTKATITCTNGYEFAGALEVLVTAVPTLPPTTTQRVPTRKDILASTPSYPLSLSVGD